MTHHTTPARLSRADRIGLYATMGIAAIGVMVVAWLMIARLVEVLPGHDVPVVVHGLAMIAGIALLAAFCWNLAGGRAFSCTNVGLVLWSAVVLAAGRFVGTTLTNMIVNGALSAISDYEYDGVVFAWNLVPFFAILAPGAIGAAFQVGERLQRDITGLV